MLDMPRLSGWQGVYLWYWFCQQMLQFHRSMHTFPSWLLQTSPGWMLDELLISLRRVLYWSLFISDLPWKPLLKSSYLCHQGCTKESNEIDFLSHLELATACNTSKPRHLFWDSWYNLLFWNSGYCLFIGLWPYYTSNTLKGALRCLVCDF